MRQQYVEEIPLPKLKVDDRRPIDDQIYRAFSFTEAEIRFIQQTVKDRKAEIIDS